MTTGGPLDQQLQSLRLLASGVPTWGALLGLGRDPQGWIPGARVQFLRIDGTEITDPIRSQKVLTGRLEDVLRQLDELLRLNVLDPNRGSSRVPRRAATRLSGDGTSAARAKCGDASDL